MVVRVRVDRAAAEAHNAEEWRLFAERLHEAQKNPPPGAEEAGVVIVPGPLIVPTRDFVLLSKEELGLDEPADPK